MKTTGLIAHADSTLKAAPSALPGASLRVNRTRAPRISRRLVLIFLAATLTALALSAAPALAAAPEAPELTIQQPVHPTEAILLGILSPGAPNRGGTYKFLYNAGASCEAGSSTLPGLSLGAEHEELPAETLTGLAPGTEYTACLSVTNLEGETTLSAPSSFKTPTVPQVPQTSSPAKSITTTTAVLEGTLNPTTPAEVGWHFLYSTEPTCASGSSETAPVAVAALPAKAKVHTEVTELQPHRKYAFCLVASNEAGETAQSANEVSFETKAAAPSIESQSASGVSSSAATLEAQVNPNNQKTTAQLQYSTSSAVNGSGALTTPTTLPSSELGEGYGAQGLANGSLTGLPPATTFYYQALATNTTGTTYGTVQSFTTVPTPSTSAPTAITATTATFNGTLTPLSSTVASEYSFDYHAGSAPTTECSGESATSTESVGTGSTTETVSSEVTALSPNTRYTVCLVDTNAFGSDQAAPVTFTTLIAAPTIESESSSDVDATEARLEASIDPGNSPTSYHFEYGTAAGAYEHSTPTQQTPAKLTATSLDTVITGLTPSTTYHYRVVASNALPASTQYGPDQTFTTTAAPPSPGTPGSCPNEKLREEQPYGLTLPDCRAYEMVSPADTNGNDATNSAAESAPRASEAKLEEAAITYASKGSFGNAEGALLENQYVSRRTPSGWGTQAVTPLFSPGIDGSTEKIYTAYPEQDFTPELTAGLALTSTQLAGAPPLGGFDGVYVAQFAGGTYRYVGREQKNAGWGASADLRRVVMTNLENESLLEWVDGTDWPVSITNTRDELAASAGSSQLDRAQPSIKDAWHATSEIGSRVYFTTPAHFETNQPGGGIGQLYVRVNVGQLQSQLADGEAKGTGTLTEASQTVTSLVAAIGETSGSEPAAGATELEGVTTNSGQFAVGAEISGPSIAPGTTITAVAGATLTLSTPTTAKMPREARIESSGPEPFAVGQKLTANGVPSGTRITAAAPGSLTLSAPAAASGTAVALTGGGQCTVAEDACTIEVSASQRFLHSNPAGTQAARYWGASADGSKAFFTSNAELTEDAHTGPAGNGANLYEYDLETGKLTDLTGEATDDTGNGAAVQGVSQISEDGSYVYFVADGALAAGASEQQCRKETEAEETGAEPKQDNLGCNLYVSHDGGKPLFIATLSAERDITDWQNGGPENAGPEVNTAVVNPGGPLNPAGSQLAFISERSLPTANFPAGYDNQQAQSGVGQCESKLENREVESGRCREVYLYDAESGRLVCASCDPTGARPVGSASIPGVLVHTDAYADYRPRALLASGSLFFDSADALASGAGAGHKNVYEYENGEVHAIANPSGGYESSFLDASPNGQNVFFASADRLTSEDPGGNAVVWDARQGGGYPAATAAAPCSSGEACEPPTYLSTDVQGSGSATFQGAGNLAQPGVVPVTAVRPIPVVESRAQKLAKALKACRKNRTRKRRVACEQTVRKRYGASKKAKHSSTERRASR